MTEEIHFTCPDCGKQWSEMQDTEDDWFGLATRQTLCDECRKKVLARIKKSWEQEKDK